MSDSNATDNHERQTKLEQVLAEFLHSIERGQPLDRSALIVAHPDLAGDLRSFFRNRESMDRLAEPLKAAAEAPTLLGLSGSGPAPDETTVRYFGDYELLEEIARGGMGVVYKARQVNLNRVVALKMILAGQLAHDSDVKRFYAEAEAAARLDHPGIVPIYEIGLHEGQHYFSMAYVEGMSLAKKIADGPLPPRDAAEMVGKVSDAVEYAHRKGIIHRDLKPANVLLDDSGQLRVTDFGLAKQLKGDSGLTGTGQILGTPSYMPPEQAAGKVDQVGPQSDVYALGAILYCLITGRPPFQAASPMDTLLQVLKQEPVSPRLLTSQVPRDLETICLKCLEKSPQRRYASARELADELGRFLSGKPIAARPVGRPERLWRWSKRHPTTAGLSAALVLTLLIATVIGSAMAVRQAALRRLAEQRQRMSSAHLYLAEIKLANQAWEDAEVERVEEILQTHRPDKGGEDLRGWEWYYLLSLCHSSPAVMEKASAIAVSPDGRQLAIGTWPGLKPILSIYDLNTGETVESMYGHTENIYSVAWSADGKRLASGGGDGTVIIWDRSTSAIVCTLAAPENGVHALAWNPTGTHVASANRNGPLRIWDVVKQKETVLLEQGGGVQSLAWRPDGLQLVSASPINGLKTWNVETWTEVTQDALPGDIAKSTLSPYCVAWAADGKRLAVVGIASGMKPVAVVWHRETNQQLTLYGHRREVKSVGWSLDGTKLATGSDDKTVRIWDAATGQQLMVLRGHTAGVNQVAWSADGRNVVAEGGGVKIWDVTQEQESTTLPSSVQPFQIGRGDISWNAQSSEIVTVDGNNVSVWDISGRLRWSLAGACGPVAWSPDGQHIAVAAQSAAEQETRQIDVWSASTKKIVAKLAGHRGSVRNLCWSPDGSRLASTSLGFQFIRNGDVDFQVESDRVIRIWDVQAGKETSSIDPGTSDYVQCIAWSPSGRAICWARSQRVGIVDAATGRSIHDFSVEDGVRTVAWSPTGDRIVVGFFSNNTLAIFESATGEMLREFKGHTASATAVSWNNDVRRIASAGEDGTIRIWDVTTGREVMSFTQRTFIRPESDAVQWSPNGERLAAWQDGGVKIFDASTGYTRERSGR